MKFGETAKVVTKMSASIYRNQQERGVRMLDNKEKVLTPVSIKYNIPSSTEEFNVVENCTKLFKQMSLNDTYMRILTGDRITVLWELNSSLPEESKFTELFFMRKQTFRKGHKKVTIYCTVESSRTINSIKFTDPLKSFLAMHNIWIKPDFYATKVVSSPGFMTLIHPRITNKPDLVHELTDVLSQTKVDKTEEEFCKWKSRNSWRIPEFENPPQIFT